MRENMTAIEIKKGDKVKVLLIASKHSTADRMSRGVTQDSYEGVAHDDLVIGQRFLMTTEKGDLHTSPVAAIYPNMFTTKNSSYSVEKL